MVIQGGNQGFNENQSQMKNQSTESNKFYSISLDKVKIFWMCILSILVLTFVFVFGYWTSQHNVNHYQSAMTEVESTEKVDQEPERSTSDEVAEVLKEDKSSREKLTVDVEKSEVSEQKVKNQDLTKNLIEEDFKDDVKKENITEEKSLPSRNQVKKVVKSVGTKKYIIQLACFKNRNRAMSLRSELLGKGFGGYVVQSGRIFKVRVGNFENYNNAANTLGKVMRRFRIKDAYIFKKRV